MAAMYGANERGLYRGQSAHSVGMMAARKLQRGIFEAATTASFFSSVRRFCTRACSQDPTVSSEIKNSHALDMMRGASFPGKKLVRFAKDAQRAYDVNFGSFKALQEVQS